MRAAVLCGCVAVVLAGLYSPRSGVDAAAKACPAGAIAIAPGKSIQAAVDAAPPDARFCIEAGVHRMQSVTPRPGQQFIGQPGAVLDGARVLDSFVRDGAYWIAEDPDRRVAPHGYCAPGHPKCAEPAGVFINGRALAQVPARFWLRPGTFLFDVDRHRIVIADDPTGKRVEAASTTYAFTGSADGVTIRGLTIEMYRNPAQTGAVNGASAKGWRVENSEIRLNSGTGVTVGSGGRIRDCNIHHNGQLGAGGTGSDIVLDGNTIWANNTALFDRAWEAGGVKLGRARNVTFRANHVYDNGGPGLWCDMDCDHVLFVGNTVERNGDAGIFFEISRDATIRGNVLRDNGQLGLSWYWGADIQIAASQDVTACDNRITVRPGGSAIMLIDQRRENADDAPSPTRGNLACRNDIEFRGAGAAGGVSDALPGVHDFSIIETGGNRFVANRYRYQPGSPPVFPWGHRELDFEEFKRIGQEAGGSLTSETAAR